MTKPIDIKAMRADAVFCYIWEHMPDAERRLICLLADISSEASWCRWHSMQGFERVALRSALASVVEDQYRSACERAQKETRPPSDDMPSVENITQ